MRLRHVAVQTVGHVTLRFEMIHQVVHHALGVAENNPKFEVMNVNQPRQQFDFEAPIHLIINLLDGRHSHRLLLDLHIFRIARIPFDQIANRSRHRGRKENRLPLLRRVFEDGFDVIAETHVEHDVGFVEDDQLHGFEPQRPAPHVIHDAARRADDDLRALLETVELALVGLPAVNRQRM